MRKALLYLAILLLSANFTVSAKEVSIPIDEYGHIVLSSYDKYADTDIVTIVLLNAGEKGQGWGIGKIIPINEWSHEGNASFSVVTDPSVSLENEYKFTIAQLKDFAKIEGQYHEDSYGQKGITINLYNDATMSSITVDVDMSDDETLIPVDQWGNVLLTDYENYTDTDVVTVVLSNAGEKGSGWGIGKIIPIGEWSHAGYAEFTVNTDPAVSLENKYNFTIAQLKEYAKIDGVYHVDGNGKSGITFNVYNDAVISKITVVADPTSISDASKSNFIYMKDDVLYMDEVANIQIIDMNGRICKTQSSAASLNVADLNHGVYFVVKHINGERTITKFIK